MSTVITPELSKKNKWYISRHKYYELKHYCLQYSEWNLMLKRLSYPIGSTISVNSQDKSFADPVGTVATLRAYYSSKIDELRSISRQADPELADYILEAVTSACSYPYLKTVMDIPCSKETFYDRYRKFFFLLARARK